MTGFGVSTLESIFFTGMRIVSGLAVNGIEDTKRTRNRMVGTFMECIGGIE